VAKPRQALLQGEIDAQTAVRQEIVDRNNVIISQNFSTQQQLLEKFS
jgi:hypothetical protein